MPTIEGFWIRNYRRLKQVAVGSSFQQTMVAMDDSAFQPYQLSPFTLFVGACGAGKTTLLDVFSLLSEVLVQGTEAAFAKRGGYSSVVSRGAEEEAITIGIEFRASADPRPLSYIVSFESGKGRAPIVSNEAILYRADAEHPSNTMLLFLQNGIKNTRHVAPWAGMKLEDLQKIKNTDQKHLALESLGKFEDYVDVFQLRHMLINWTCPTMELDLSVGLSPMAIPRNKNEARAAFLLEQIKAMEKKHLYDFNEALPFLAKHLPDIESVHLTKTESGNMLLQFKNKFFKGPFNAHEVSPGLLRLFAYSLFLEDSIPYPFIGFDSIDDNLDERYCQALISQIYNHIDNIASTQFLTTANSPYLVDQVDPNDVWVLEQTPDGFASVFRGSDDLAMRNVNMQEMPPNTRWYTDFVNRPS